MIWRNERSLYNGKCGLCGKDTISVFRPQEPARKAYCQRCYYSEGWDPLSYGRDYDFSVPFVENMRRLAADVPFMMLYQVGVNENCEYTNFAGGGGMKNCYLIFNSGDDQDCYHSRGLIQSKDCSDMLIAAECEKCYGCVNCNKSYGLSFSRNCSQCTDSAFLSGCIGCRNCIGCVNLSHQEYQIFNQPVTPQQFAEFRVKMGSHEFLTKVQAKFEELVRDGIHRENNNVNVENCTGDYLASCQNCFDCFEAKGSQDCKRTTSSKLIRDSHDTFGFGYESELLYEDVAVGYSIRSAFSFTCDTVSDSLYCMYCKGSPNCFGCVGLMRQEYCVFNRKYTKAEYEVLVPRIIEAMRATGEWGEYFAPSLCPFGYNESVAMEYDPLTKEEALAQGFHWSDYVAPMPKVEKVVSASRLPDNIKDTPDEILNWAVECEVTGKPFRVIKPELTFLRENNLPFPRRHPDTRHFERVALRNPRKLFDRACAKCGRGMKTTYAPERPEKVYCEECYREEVY